MSTDDGDLVLMSFMDVIVHEVRYENEILVQSKLELRYSHCVRLLTEFCIRPAHSRN